MDDISFGRHPSFSDYREEMTTFSSLPTSHFTLRPSSFDVEMNESPTQYWNQSTYGYKLADSDSWNWNQPGNGAGSDWTHWQRKAESEVINEINNSPAPPYPSSSSSSAPSNYASNLFHSNGNPKQVSTQQQVADQENSVESSKKDVSRSSLSVTDSKTIVLTNSPGPWNSAGNKKKETEKLPTQQLNHKLAKSVKSHTSPPQLEEPPPPPPPPEQPEGSVPPPKTKKLPQAVRGGGGGGGDVKVNGVLDDKKSVKNNKGKSEGGGGDKKRGGAASTGNNNGSGSMTTETTAAANDDGGGGASQTKTNHTPTSSPKIPTSAGDTNVMGASNPAPSPANVEDRGGLGTTTNTTKAPAPTKKTDPSPASGSRETKKDKLPSNVDVWSVKGPANGILSLNVRHNAKRDKLLLKKSKRNDNMTGASLESALLITSQFLSKTATKKKDEAGSGGGGTDILPPLGGILVRGSIGNRSGSSTPTILGPTDVPTVQKLSGVGASGLSTGKLSEIQPPAVSNSSPQQQQQQQDSQTNSMSVASQPTGVQRINSIISDSLVGGGHMTVTVAQNLTGVTRHSTTPSANTNGTNFQEIFSSTKRKLTESTERGLKQALAGCVS